ncbi:class I SAM-dependent methyltransferase [Candidatus Woesearchaeota archaeon]|nr:class I SAM-dependent methyltransferase [Candidatus Woesearchaeota archaeon]
MAREPYADFVAHSGQVNTPPGSYSTVKEWVREGFISSQSYVLEIGCNTGFIAHTVNRYTRASVVGIDASLVAVETATANNSHIPNLSFMQAYAQALPFTDSSFSHVIVGGHLPWVERDERKAHVIEAARVLRPGGFMMTSLYYFRDRPPAPFLDRFNAAFQTWLTPDDDHDHWSSLFDLDNLVLEHESAYRITPPDEDRKNRYLKRFENGYHAEWKEKIALFEKNGERLDFFVKVFHKIGSSDPYIQIPRGGIYTWKRTEES